MQNRPIRLGELVSEVRYSSSTCRIQHECQVRVPPRTKWFLEWSFRYEQGICCISMSNNLLAISQDQFARARAVLDECFSFLYSLGISSPNHPIHETSRLWIGRLLPLIIPYY
jgi:hypothetical protein